MKEWMISLVFCKEIQTKFWHSHFIVVFEKIIWLKNSFKKLIDTFKWYSIKIFVDIQKYYMLHIANFSGRNSVLVAKLIKKWKVLINVKTLHFQTQLNDSDHNFNKILTRVQFGENISVFCNKEVINTQTDWF